MYEALIISDQDPKDVRMKKTVIEELESLTVEAFESDIGVRWDKTGDRNHDVWIIVPKIRAKVRAKLLGDSEIRTYQVAPRVNFETKTIEEKYLKEVSNV